MLRLVFQYMKSLLKLYLKAIRFHVSKSSAGTARFYSGDDEKSNFLDGGRRKNKGYFLRHSSKAQGCKSRCEDKILLHDFFNSTCWGGSPSTFHEKSCGTVSSFSS